MTNQEQLALLEELLLARGPAGQEEEVREICRRELEQCCDEVWQDPAANLIGCIKAVGVPRDEAERLSTRVMAHQDEIAMVVKRIDADGRLRVVALGGAFPVNFGMCPVDSCRHTNGCRRTVLRHHARDERIEPVDARAQG